MDTSLVFGDAAGIETGLLAVFAIDASEGKDAEASVSLLTGVDAVSKAAASALASGEFKAKLGETLLLHAPAGLKSARLLVVGLGKAKSLKVDDVRKGAGAAVRAAKPRAIRELAILFPTHEALAAGATARTLVEGAEIAELDWDTYRSERKDQSVRQLKIVAATPDKGIEDGFAEGIIVASAQNFARHLVNEPGNVLTPTVLGARAKAMCDEVGLACEVFGMDKLKELGMGAFIAVAQGSVEAPALIVMTYTPEGEVAPNAPVMGLVGKGITFDTGGISIKPADNMEKMKYDMAGSAAMIGAMRAIAQLKPRVKVISVVCSAENMPSGTAFKPGDVVTAMSGKTIEIINTDAEGRLVLADGLHYAKTLGCTHLVDAATLTGACVVALGHLNVGLFSNDEATWTKFMDGTRHLG